MNENEHIHSKDQASQESIAHSKELANCQQELGQWKDRAHRIGADFENYKKRVDREKAQWVAMAQSNILLDLLTIVDDFDRALDQARNNPSDQIKTILEGLELTKKSLDKLLTKYDVTEIKETKEFNPEFHEAVMNVESSTEPSGSVVQVLQKGYMLKEQVLRPAKVSVAQ